jgi:hypothetical protein
MIHFRNVLNKQEIIDETDQIPKLLNIFIYGVFVYFTASLNLSQ